MSEFKQVGFLLGQNMDILACAAGYTRNQFLAKVRIHPSTYNCRLVNGLPLSEEQIEKVEKYIRKLGDPFLTSIYEKACSRLLERFDIFQSGDELKIKSYRAILKTNLKAFRYFLGLDQLSLAKSVPCSKNTIQHIEENIANVSEDTCYHIYKTLEKEASKQGLESKQIFETGSNFVIATKIPNYTRC